ncbi:Exodeoxyribonuclease 7 large subunit [uncultured Clostridium sp.]|uniref:exodeoxyribonuclease VII large subunit n=1 Tax=uncultured Clostridium sp. TaxID=59620 RepID=UPI00082226FD|nr:exodeoxyribonuclease VII large subunit [uncultured Clostridium sp.]SCJ54185.1 Exodeoxyribonuclease 7 large subunit [uncultured Clostridium sp.]
MKIKTLSVSEVNNYIKKILDNDFILNNLSVKGEISNLKLHSSGHIYFSLKDSAGKINCIMFKNRAYDLQFTLEDGMEVIVKGRASVYTASGTFQIYCDEIQKEGIGELYIKFEKLKSKLAKEGYFDEELKKDIPKVIRSIGVVTSETGAAIQDIKNVIRRRNSLVDIMLYPAQVQGNGAYKTIIEGVKYFNRKKNVDVIIIGRGGGSIEELWNFNEEDLAIAIFKSNIPIVSAVGHEVDFTISDFVADLRAATPSQAAELVTPLEKEIYIRIENNQYNLNKIMERKFDVEKNLLESYDELLRLKTPLNKIVNGYLEVQNLKERLDFTIKNKIDREKHKLISLNEILQARSPINILRKGYAIIKDDNDNFLKSVGDFSDKEDINITLKDGYVKGSFILTERGGDL